MNWKGASNCMIINKKPSQGFENYTITEEQRKKIILIAEKGAIKSSNGIYWMGEAITNSIGLTPRHISENFVNLRIEVGGSSNRPEYGKQYALTGATGDKCLSNGNSWKESEVK